jgi:hypothetical protein
MRNPTPMHQPVADARIPALRATHDPEDFVSGAFPDPLTSRHART